MTVAQTATTVAVTRTGANGDTTTTYTTDGTTKTTLPAGRGGAATATAKWDASGATLTITTTTEGTNGPTTRTAVWSMEAGDLVIATTAPPRGGTGDPVTTKVYYKKGM
jgi:hypothetical protein